MGWGSEKHGLVSGRVSLLRQHAPPIEFPRIHGRSAFGLSAHFSTSRRAGTRPERIVPVCQNTPRARLWVSRGGLLADVVLQLGRVIKRSTVSHLRIRKQFLALMAPRTLPHFKWSKSIPSFRSHASHRSSNHPLAALFYPRLVMAAFHLRPLGSSSSAASVRSLVIKISPAAPFPSELPCPPSRCPVPHPRRVPLYLRSTRLI